MAGSISLAGTGGVHGHEEAMKMLLAGADVVHLCSCLLSRGPEYLGEIWQYAGLDGSH